ncbi:tRNA methyltransferase [Sarcoptes scabiei]|nr:tRNA methyltransferase [Sarcoptes scabiei]
MDDEVCLEETNKSNEPKVYQFVSKFNDRIEIEIFENISDKYSSIIWPSTSLLCQFIFDNKDWFQPKTLLELGSGTGLCGIFAAKICSKVILTDQESCDFDLMKKNIQRNGVEKNCFIFSLEWGNMNRLAEILASNEYPIDCIIGSDLCYDESQFENLFLTVAYLMKALKSSSSPTESILFFMTYHLRCSNENIECLLRKLGLSGQLITHDSNFKIYLYKFELKNSE